MNNHDILKEIQNKIDEAKELLARPTSIYTIDEYKFFVGFINGLQESYDFIKKSLTWREDNE
jgi:hypothetical protein